MHEYLSSPKLQADYAALTLGTGLVDLSQRTHVEITGKDRTSFLQGFCTNDIKKLVAGRGCEAFLTSIKGKLLSHVSVFSGTDSLVLETVPGQAEAIIAHLDHYVIREDVQLHDRSVTWSERLLGGAQAECLLRRICAGELPTEILAHGRCQLADLNICVRRVEWTLAPCFLIQCLAADAQRLDVVLNDAGATRCGWQVWDIARVEAGWPEYGRDITSDNLPQEVGRDKRAISFTKGCYLGQETVARLDALGHVNRKLVGLQFSGEQIPAPGLELTVEQQAVGCVTSGVWSPRLGRPLALGYVRRQSQPAGTCLTSAIGPAEVVELPLSGAVGN
ncbi:MAG: folate-binding protein [Planctomycetota bacterium]|nr:folate-binding protein [Planctomycetota bacterium]